MVITVRCPSCDTAFPVDTNKVPPGGVYARCSECAGVFFVERPQELHATAPAASTAAPPFATPAEVPAAAERLEPTGGWPEAAPALEEETYQTEAWAGAAASSPQADPWSESGYDTYELGSEAPPLGAGAGLQDSLSDTALDAGAGLEQWAPQDTLFVPPEPVEVSEEIEAEVFAPPSGAGEWMEAAAEPAAMEVAPEPAPEPEAFEITEVFQEPPLAPSQPVREESPAPLETPPFQTPAAPESVSFEERAAVLEETPPAAAPPSFQAAPAEVVSETPAAAPPAWTPPPEPPPSWTPRPEPSPAPVAPPSAPAPTFTFGRRDPHEKAKRLARVLVSDMIMYNPERHSRAIASGSLREDFDDEIKKSWQEYVDQVGDEIAKNTSYFDDALNDILARGQRVFP